MFLGLPPLPSRLNDFCFSWTPIDSPKFEDKLFDFFANSWQYMYANIANFIVDVLLNMNKSNELYNL